MAIRIKRSSGNAAPSSLASGQLAYTEGTNNTLYYGKIDGTVIPIGGAADHTKLAGIESGAQVNTVTSVAGRTGAVTITSTDLSDFSTAADARISAASIDALADVVITTPANGQQLSWDSASSKWINTAPSSGVTAFVQLNDVPSSFSGQGLKWVRVNSGATALEFTTDIDDGTF
jgi:hypothetical protein